MPTPTNTHQGAVRAADRQPIRVTNPETITEFVIIAAEAFERLSEREADPH